MHVLQCCAMCGFTSWPSICLPGRACLTLLQVLPTPRPGDAQAASRRPLRAGYAGHLTQVANRLIQVANEGHQQVRRAGCCAYYTYCFP
jgi:hypothetical protein